MEQHLSFLMKERERLTNLTNLLEKLLNENGIRFVDRGAARGQLDEREIDFDSYALFSDQTQIGHYKFVLKKGFFNCELDLAGLPEENYNRLKETVKKEFPEVTF